jgi:hypothetical protein
MVSRFRILLLSALAAAPLMASSAFAQSASNHLKYEKPSKHHPVHHGEVYVGNRSSDSDLFGVVKDPGGSDRYFSDTKNPLYPLGAGFAAYRGFDNLPEGRDPFWQPPYN